MLPEIEQLLILQDRDRKIRTLRHELKMAPLQRADLEGKQAASTAAFDKVRQSAKELEVERKKLEVDAQAKRDTIAKFKTQQFQTRKNEEFQALSNEIKRYEKDIEGIEDRELDLMEQNEKMKVAVASADKETAQTKALITQQLSDLEKKLVTLNSQLEALSADRAKLAEQVDEDLLNRYDRLFSSKGDAAVVPLNHEVCTGCHMKITTQTAVRVKARREIIGCEQCGRILYSEE